MLQGLEALTSFWRRRLLAQMLPPELLKISETQRAVGESEGGGRGREGKRARRADDGDEEEEEEIMCE